MRTRVGLAILIAVSAAMQAAIAVRSGLWADEVFSLAMATGHSMEHPAAAAEPARGDFVETAEPVNVAELQRYLRMEDEVSTPANVLRAVALSDTSPPLYYLLLHGWLRVAGTSDFALRAFAIMAALACVPLVFWIARDVHGERGGWMAAVLFAAAPMTLYYGTEARMYPLLWLCVLTVAAATLRLMRGQRGWGVSAIWIAGSAAGFWVHYYFLFAWAALAAGWAMTMAMERRGKEKAVELGRLGLHAVAVVALMAPWYARLPDVFAAWRITQDWVTWKSDAYTWPKVAMDSLTRWFSGDGNYLWRPHRKVGLMALAVFGASAALMWWRDRRRMFGAQECLVWAWWAAAALGPLLVDALRGTFIAEYPRYSTPALPAACVLGGWMLASWRGGRGGVAILVVLLCWSLPLRSIYRNDGRSGQPTREAARRVNAAAEAGDLVLIQSVPTGALSLARYLTAPVDAAVWVEQLGQRRVPESLARLIDGKRAVWVVSLHLVGASAPAEEWLRERARVSREERVGNIAIREFRPREGETF